MLAQMPCCPCQHQRPPLQLLLLQLRLELVLVLAPMQALSVWSHFGLQLRLALVLRLLQQHPHQLLYLCLYLCLLYACS